MDHSASSTDRHRTSPMNEIRPTHTGVATDTTRTAALEAGWFVVSNRASMAAPATSPSTTDAKDLP